MPPIETLRQPKKSASVRIACLLALIAITLTPVWSSAAIQDNGARSGPIQVTLLGTGSPTMRMDRFGPSILVEAGGEHLLFDVGRGASLRLNEAGFQFADINKIFLTHLHSDHINGFPDLWLSGWIHGRRDVPLRVWGPTGTDSFTSNLYEAYSFDIRIRSEVDTRFETTGIEIQSIEIEEGVIYESDDVKVTAFEVDHSPIKPAFGYRVDYNGASVVLSGDTRQSTNLVKYAKGANLLIHEVASADDRLMSNKVINAVIKHHTTPEEAGEIFKEVRPQLAVYSHLVLFGDRGTLESTLVERTLATYDGKVILGKDLMVIEVGDQTHVLNH